MIERAAHTQLYAYLESHQLLVRNQFGFRRGRSTPLALTQFTEGMVTNMDNGLLNRVIFLDLRKAFDTVDHTIYKLKAELWEFRGLALLAFSPLRLVFREQLLVKQRPATDVSLLEFHIHGSILGPLLFSIYISELPACLKHTSMTLFADDTALYCSAKSSTDLQKMLNEDLASVAEWLNDHKLTLNVAKSTFMIIGGSKRLKALGTFSLQICDEFLDKADFYI